MKVDNLEKLFEDVYKTSHLREMTATSFLKSLDGCIRSSLNNEEIDGSKLKELLSTRNALFTKGVENSTDKSIKSPTKEFLSYKDKNGNELSGFIANEPENCHIFSVANKWLQNLITNILSLFKENILII